MGSSAVYSFGPFEIDSAARRLTRNGEPVPVADRHFNVLVHLVAQAGAVVSKDALVEAGWQEIAVTDNSLEQAVSALRRTLGTAADGQPYIQTVPRQGYRFAATVSRTAARATDAALDALLTPHRGFLEGRAAIETLERDGIVRARKAFESVLANGPDQPSAHIGLANACIMQFEMTRTDEVPDAAALNAAIHHAREACRLDVDAGEAWATLGFVLDRAGQRLDAAAASRRAVTLEPDNWRHHFRLAYVSWGEERLRAAHRTLALLPGFPLAHWLAATVHVARQVLAEADRELAAGIAVLAGQGTERSRFSAVALHWLRGLVHLARDDDARALEAFERELAFESSGHLYARECCANTWYAIGALRLRESNVTAARAAFEHAVERVPRHPMARAALRHIDARAGATRPPFVSAAASGADPTSIDAALSVAASLVLAGAHAEAAQMVDRAVAAAPAGNAGWLLPVEPLLRVHANLSVWEPALARVRTRAA